jgi:hypothetical protein
MELVPLWSPQYHAPMSVYQIVIAPGVHAQLKLGNLTHSAQKEACDAVRNACNGARWKFTESIENKCVFFWNEHGGEIAKVAPVDGPYWRQHPA